MAGIKSDGYKKALIICHGKSEEIFSKNIRSNLRLPICIYRDPKGNSIQITSIKHLMRSRLFKQGNFTQEMCKYISEDNKNGLKNFKIFFIMDTDDCDGQMLKKYKNKTMFNNHWLKPYIVPIYNSPNLDQVLIDLGYDIDPKRKVASYQKVFPGVSGDMKTFEKLLDLFEKCPNRRSNMKRLLKYLYSFLDKQS